MVTSISGLLDVVERFDLFLLDQFGVLHDGASPYPETTAVLDMLRERGKPVVIISNSGKRAETNIVRMARMGIARDRYSHMVTSGEVAWTLLRAEMAAGTTEDSGARFKSCYLITSGGELSPVADLDIDIEADPARADVILLAGSEGNRFPEAHYRDLLAPAAARGVPCICTNPDKISLIAEERYFGPGRIAEIYQGLGGRIRWIGKPHPEIYRFAMALHPEIDPTRVLCVGDSIEHDIVGASAAGLASALVLGGILAGAPREEIDQLFIQHGARADYVMPLFAM